MMADKYASSYKKKQRLDNKDNHRLLNWMKKFKMWEDELFDEIQKADKVYYAQ